MRLRNRNEVDNPVTLLNKLGKLFEKLCSWIVILLTGVMCLTILAQVFSRYLLGKPLTWSEELARYTMIWVTFLGTAVAQKRGTLVCVDMFLTAMPPKVQKVFRALSDIISLLFSGTMTYLSILFAGGPSAALQKSPALHLPMWLVDLCVPIGFGLIFFNVVLNILNKLFRKPDAELEKGAEC